MHEAVPAYLQDWMAAVNSPMTRHKLNID